MTNVNGWKTLGLSSHSRLWVTAGRHTTLGAARRATSPYSLALGGQATAPLRVNVKLASRYGRNFIFAKRLFFVGFCAYSFELFAQNLLAAGESFYVLAATTSAHAVFNCLLLACPFLWAAWYRATRNGCPTSLILGGLTLALTTVFVALFRTLPLEATAAAKSAAEAKKAFVDLAKFADIKNPLTWEKSFVTLVYRSVQVLSKFDARPLTLPEAKTNASCLLTTQTPPKVFTNARPFQLRLARACTLGSWPDLLNVLAGANTKTTLLLFQWQSAHASWGSKLSGAAPLWHARKLPRLLFSTKGVAALTQGPLTSPAPQNAAPLWLNLRPNTSATFALKRNRFGAPRYDLLQSLAPAATRAWGSRFRPGK